MSDQPEALRWARIYRDICGWVPVFVAPPDLGSDIPIDKRGGKSAVANYNAIDPTDSYLERSFGRGVANIGVVCGDRSGGLVDIDLDCPEAVRLAPYFLPPTTWRFGRDTRPASHWLYRSPGVKSVALATSSDKGSTLVEIRADKHYTVFPPSIHADGNAVRWEGGADGAGLEGAGPPDVDRDALKRAVHRLAIACVVLRHMPDEGHDARLSAAGCLARLGWDEDAVTHFLASVMEVRGHGEDDVAPVVRSVFARIAENQALPPGVDKKEVRGFTKFVAHVGLDPALKASLSKWLGEATPAGALPPHGLGDELGRLLITDAGLADRFVGLYGARFKFCEKNNEWYCWENGVWVAEKLAVARTAVLDMVRGIGDALGEAADRVDLEEPAEEAGSDGKKPKKKQTRKQKLLVYERMDRIDGVLKFVGLKVLVGPNDFDADPWALNVRNGTIDLRTGTLLPHDPSKLCSKMAPAVFDPLVVSAGFAGFVAHVVPNADTRRYLQKLVGCAATGVVRDHVFPALWGDGANGKSTLVEALSHTLGDYAGVLPASELMAQGENSHPAALARLQGKRFVVASESREGQALYEGRVKLLTGGDSIPVRLMRENWWELKPTHKLFLVTNHRPRVHGRDTGIWRRIKLIPFSVQIPPKQQVLGLLEGLKNEASGILNWILEGVRLWQTEGLVDAPTEVTLANDEYRENEDTFGAFLEECCDTGVDFKERPDKLSAAMKTWYKANSEAPPGSAAFGSIMRSRGFERRRSGDGRMWVGLRVKPFSMRLGVASPPSAVQ